MVDDFCQVECSLVDLFVVEVVMGKQHFAYVFVLSIFEHDMLYHILCYYISVVVCLLWSIVAHNASVFFIGIVQCTDVWLFGALCPCMTFFAADEASDFFTIFEGVAIRAIR